MLAAVRDQHLRARRTRTRSRAASWRRSPPSARGARRPACRRGSSGSRQAAAAASTMWAGVGKSGSPAPKPITFSPCALSALALASTARVADGAIAARRSETRFTAPHAATSRSRFPATNRLSDPCPVPPDPAQITLPASILPADGRFGCGPSKVRPGADRRDRGRRDEPDRHVAPQAAGEDTSSVRSAPGCATCSRSPTAGRSCSATAARPCSGTPPRSHSSSSAASTSSSASSRPSSPRSARPRRTSISRR